MSITVQLGEIYAGGLAKAMCRLQVCEQIKEQLVALKLEAESLANGRIRILVNDLLAAAGRLCQEMSLDLADLFPPEQEEITLDPLDIVVVG